MTDLAEQSIRELTEEIEGLREENARLRAREDEQKERALSDDLTIQAEQNIRRDLETERDALRQALDMANGELAAIAKDNNQHTFSTPLAVRLRNSGVGLSMALEVERLESGAARVADILENIADYSDESVLAYDIAAAMYPTLNPPRATSPNASTTETKR